MNNPGLKNLGDQAITVALTNEVITDGNDSNEYIDDLDGMVAGTIYCNFGYGSGGTTCIVKVQTTLDGTNWIDIARFDFAQASRHAHCNLSGLTPATVATVAALSAEGRLDGILGSKMRTSVTSTGTYAGSTTVAVRLQAR